MVSFQVSHVKYFNVSDHYCSGEYEWVRIFYRCVDGLDCSEGSRLREVEFKLFLSFAKSGVERELGIWSGSVDQHNLADAKIALSVRNAFKNYEDEKNDYEKSFFNF